MSLLSNLSGLFGRGANTVARDAGQGVNFLSGAAGKLLGGSHQPPQYTTPTEGQINNPLSLGNVEGTIASKTAGDSAGFTPNFLNMLLKTMPYQQQKGDNLVPRDAGAEFDPSINRIIFGGRADPSGIAHENLHNVYQNDSTQATRATEGVIKPSLSPEQTDYLNKILETSLYGGNVNTPNLATEVHSFAGTEGFNLSPKAQSYYNQFFPQDQLNSAEQSYRMRGIPTKFLANNLGLESGALPRRPFTKAPAPYRGDYGA